MRERTQINKDPSRVTAQRGMESHIPTFSMAVISSSGSVVGDMAVMPDASMMVDTAPWAIRNRAFISSMP